MERERAVHERESKWRLVLLDFTDLHRARKLNYGAFHTNARIIPYLRTVITVFVLYKKI